jgi:hypothetical protein
MQENQICHGFVFGVNLFSCLYTSRVFIIVTGEKKEKKIVNYKKKEKAAQLIVEVSKYDEQLKHATAPGEHRSMGNNQPQTSASA